VLPEIHAVIDASARTGTGVLKRFNIVYDYPHNTIVAWPSRYFTTPDTFAPPEF
jgi:hypothetical protein